ncbi:hypothetical protein BDW75DRAFT_225280, partial [Aspergillus navahoensis]
MMLDPNSTVARSSRVRAHDLYHMIDNPKGSRPQLHVQELMTYALLSVWLVSIMVGSVGVP